MKFVQIIGYCIKQDLGKHVRCSPPQDIITFPPQPTLIAFDEPGAEQQMEMQSIVPGIFVTIETNEYNVFNRLKKTQNEKHTALYSYNSGGLRISKTVDGMATKQVWDGSNISAEISGNTVTNKYTRGINLIKDNVNFFMYNAHGDVVQLLNTSGIITKSYKYDAFGNERNINESDTNPWRYCGEYFDKETGSVYLRARYYDPGIGCFLSADTHWSTVNMIYGDMPVTISGVLLPDIYSMAQSLNLYTYCIGNPLLFLDSSGRNAKVGALSYSSDAAGGTTGYRFSTIDTSVKNTGSYASQTMRNFQISANAYAEARSFVGPETINSSTINQPIGAGAPDAGMSAMAGAVNTGGAGSNNGGSGSNDRKDSDGQKGSDKVTAPQATEAAKKLGYVKTNYKSHGQPVYYNPKTKTYITPDVDGHNGGTWKMSKSVDDLASKTTRMGTYDANLMRIGD